MEHPRRLIHTTHIPIRWGDMDAFGHVNNTVYFRFAEQARVEWLATVGAALGGHGGRLPDVLPVIVNASCTFIVPMNYPGIVDLRMYAGAAGRSSLQTYYEMRLVGDEQRIHAEGAAKMVWMSQATGKSVPLPEPVRRIAEALDPTGDQS